MQSREIINFVLQKIDEKNATKYSIRKNTGVTEMTVQRIKDGGGTTIETIVKLADFVDLEIIVRPKNQ